MPAADTFHEDPTNRTSAWQFVRDVVMRWIDDEPFLLASSLSYYTLFSLTPLLLIAIAVAGLFFGQEAARNQIVETIAALIGPESAQAVGDMIENARDKPTQGVISSVLGAVTLLIGAGGVVGQLQTSLNKVWEVEAKPNQGIWLFVRQRFISFAMVLAVGFLLLVSLVVSALLTAFSQLLGSWAGGAAFLSQLLDLIFSFALTTLLFAMIYKFVPDVEVRWRDVWIGAGLTSILFTVGKFLIGLYLGSSGVASAYGAAGSIITILLWVYYSSLIFLLGAEFTERYARVYGSGVVPSAIAESSADAESPKRQAQPRRRA